MREPRLRVGELCAGYGGLSLAVEYALGAETTWLAETPGILQFWVGHHPSVCPAREEASHG